ncbi:MAG: hypothetical protein Q9227_009444 [Pyrenula ochraceoflavens]
MNTVCQIQSHHETIRKVDPVRTNGSMTSKTGWNYHKSLCRIEAAEIKGSIMDGINRPIDEDVFDNISDYVDEDDSVPPLTRGASMHTADSRTSSMSYQNLSSQTEIARPFSTYPLLEEEEGNPGVLLVPYTPRAPGDLVCPFQFLDCVKRFEYRSEVPWRTHTMTHFRGFLPPPKALCPLCSVEFESPNNAKAQLAWDSMLSHLSQTHFLRGETLKLSRPNFDLYKWMWQRRLMSSKMYKDLWLRPPKELSQTQHVEKDPGAKIEFTADKEKWSLVENTTALESSAAVQSTSENTQIMRVSTALPKAEIPTRSGEPGEPQAFKASQEAKISRQAEIFRPKLSDAELAVTTRLTQDSFGHFMKTWWPFRNGVHGTREHGHRDSSDQTSPSDSSTPLHSKKRDLDGDQHSDEQQQRDSRNPTGNGSGRKGQGGDRQGSRLSKRSDTSLRLRCPFTALDSPEAISRSCLKVATPKVDDLKQYHLKIHHGLNIAQMRIARGGTEEEKWLKLFQKLFPCWQSEHVGMDPPSPFADANYRLLHAYSVATREEAGESERVLQQLNPDFLTPAPIPGFGNEAMSVFPEESFSILPANPSSTSERPLELDFQPDDGLLIPSSEAFTVHLQDQSNPICRCLSHTDICGRRHLNKAEEICLCCQRLLPWSKSAADHVIEVDDSKMCQCQQHETLCLSLRSEYDARKCACCKGWYAWSEQARPLVRSAKATNSRKRSDNASDMFGSVNFDEFLNSGSKLVSLNPRDGTESVFPEDPDPLAQVTRSIETPSGRTGHGSF